MNTTLKEKLKLKAAFKSAETTDQMLKAFHQMEMSESCDETDIGLASIIFGFHLVSVEDFDKALTFAIRAFKCLNVLDSDSDSNPSLPVSIALNLMGCVHFGLKRFSDSLHYLNRAYTMVGRLQDEGSLSDDGMQIYLFLNIKLAQAHDAVENYKEALPFCLKAVELREKWMGPYSLEVANDRRLLADIYGGLGEHEKELEQNALVKRIVKNRGDKSNVLLVEREAARIMITLG
ncbi:hypothetical protein RIF29_20993 [Crotalaria pallida]|uniref:MalT-like TPR region domain-containing protein n=1 Tax=Crotalaria pallida TaxID=3830 RepID=A0AAN9F3M7_CROPI